MRTDMCLAVWLPITSTAHHVIVLFKAKWLLGTKRNCLPFLWFISRAFDNHMTVDHVTVWEASSIFFFWTRRSYWCLLQPLLYEKHVHTNHLTRTRTTSVTSAIHHLVLGATIALLFIFTQPLRSGRIWHKVNF